MSQEQPAKEIHILEMTPRGETPLKDWLGTALTRFALGGVTVGQVMESWMTQPPAREPIAPEGEARAFDEWTWNKAGEPIGNMSPVEAAKAAWMARAARP